MNNLKDLNWKIAFTYGSIIYDTVTDKSNENYIFIGGNDILEFTIDEDKIIKVFPLQNFLVFIEMHEPIALECLSILNNNRQHIRINDKKFENILNQYYNLTYNPQKLIKAFITKSNKCFNLAKDYFLNENIYKGKLFLFHSIRILDFCYQILLNKYIIDYSSMNYIYNDIQNLVLSKNLTENYLLDIINKYKIIKKDFQKRIDN